MAFIETPRFPESISIGSAGGPTFRTGVFEGNTGLEQRAAHWSRAKHIYDISLGIRDQDDMELVRDFFLVARGRRHSFRYRDWNDYTLTD